MKRIGVLIFSFTLWMALPGCIKDDNGCKDRSPQDEEATIVAYATANSINAVKHSSGLYYEILNPGTGANPSTSSVVRVTYTGKLLDGTIFDQLNAPLAEGWLLNGLIEGWKVGLPLIKAGGSIRLLIPSSMGYGCTGAGPIPGNSILDFEVNLVSVN